MTRLHRTQLTTSQKTEFAASVIALQDMHRSVSALSRRFEVSRPTTYAAQATTRAVLNAHFSPTPQARVQLNVDAGPAASRSGDVATHLTDLNPCYRDATAGALSRRGWLRRSNAPRRSMKMNRCRWRVSRRVR